jgi:hypothetical protein
MLLILLEVQRDFAEVFLWRAFRCVPPVRYLGGLELADGLRGDGFFDGLVLGHGVPAAPGRSRTRTFSS